MSATYRLQFGLGWSAECEKLLKILKVLLENALSPNERENLILCFHSPKSEEKKLLKTTGPRI